MLWDTVSGTNLLTLNEGHTDWIRRLCTHPSSSLFASASKDENIIVWSSETVKKLSSYGEKSTFNREDPIVAIFSGHSHVIDCIVFAPIESARSIQRMADGSMTGTDTKGLE